MGKKLDLTKLSDDEAKHVWEVVQRDISLRRKEEERLEDLKFKVEKESAKREILSGQSRLNNTHCLHCLNPFQFLLNSKRQCQDCKFYVCKNCSRYNKKEQGWVCDTCRATRMVKIGSLEWYYDHVRSRFKRFGSAKVMRHLYTRLQPDARGGTNLTGLSDRVYSLPDISREYLRQARSGMFHDDDEDIVDSAEAQRYSMMRKTKRLLSVHPFDFEIDSEYSAQSRRQSMQLSPTLEQDVFQSFSEYTSTGKDAPQKDSLIAEAELASMFHHLLQEQDQNMAPPEQEFSTEVRLTVNRRRSLENTRRPSSPSLLPKGSQYSGDMDSSDEERGAIHKVPPRRRSRASSQENVHHSGTQISELNKRMSTIERMLNRLEERISVASDESTGPGFHTDADIEEETLKRKLGELASNISDKGGSSDDEKILKSKQMSRSYNVRNPDPSQKRIAAQALCDITAKTLRTINATERAMQEALGDESQHVAITSTKMRGSKKAQSEFQNLEENVYMAAEKAYGLENNLKDLEERACQSTTDSELSEIEVSVASAMAQVQQAESEVSDIESRIAALSAAGLTVSPSEKAKRKSSPQTSVTAISRSTEPFMPSSPELYNLNSTPSEAKILSMQDALRKKFNIDSQLSDGVFERNALYRGSLTQRNPNGKNKKVDRMFAKPPILTQR
ncbi:melanophilin isoform X1 [Pelobates cultripes]|uniref:Melanophilin isoform X1 n=1 Tax=Pelobates cultripes TaxID=61616 RepID=A0AAD1SMY1_PELCU|nr:melanophilin isoform X1 [Pelobates cultripes]CAH2306255.1 melanophilin isoform X1 [Pelobates cultripes]